MILSFKSSNETLSELPRQLLGRVGRDFRHLIDNNLDAIKELNAGGAQAQDIIIEMKKHVSATLPHVNPGTIVGGILTYTNDPYISYTQQESKQRNKKIGQTVTKKSEEKYFNTLGEYLKNETFATRFGIYHLDLNSINYEVESSTPFQFTYTHQNGMFGKVKAHSTGDQFILEEDVVGLHDFAADLKSPYMEMDTNHVTGDFGNVYSEKMNNDYIPNSHRPCVEGLDKLLSM